MIGSQYNRLLTLEYLQTENENKYFDRKSGKIKPSDLSKHISAFANADGGTMAIGLDDNKTIEGINQFGEKKINDFINAPRNYCKPMPRYEYELIDVLNSKGDPDRILLLHIGESVDQIIRTSSELTYLRIGDRSVEMRGDDLRNLEYAKSARHYEDEINPDAEMSDLNEDLLTQYAEHIGATDLSFKEILKARGFIKTHGREERLTNAAVLLFAKNVYQFYPNCRIRFLRYDGNYAQVGTNINLIRDTGIECSLLEIIEKAKEFIATQLREFTLLDEKTGKFQVVPEYPEFAWQEGIVNAVVHREYAMTGSYIKVTMYDDRLEIESPGKLPNIVTVENIRETRFSRNPRISRVLTEMGWVRELNEGVKRIYSDMESFFLEEPIYSEPEQSVRLVLKNNIIMRSIRQNTRTLDKIGTATWDSLDKIEKEIISYMINKGPAKTKELTEYTGKSAPTITNRLKKLIEKGIVQANGNQFDPNRNYEVVFPEPEKS